MEIVHFPHPALRWKSKPIARINSELRDIVREMFELMYASRGIGLAANQVALPFRLFIANPSGDPEQKEDELVFVNPEIVKRTGSVEGEEGCLSLPELYGPVRRAESIIVEAFDLTGRDYRYELDDLDARIIQHEYDHIEGVMFIDRMDDSQRRELDDQVTDFEAVFAHRQQIGELPSNEELEKSLRDWERRFCE